MVHQVINDNLNYYFGEVFNYNGCEFLLNISTELRFTAYTGWLKQKIVTPEIMIIRDVLELRGIYD